jgi:hypothetical protein
MDYGSLSTDQQGKLMSRINDLAVIENDDEAEEYAEDIKRFIDMLVYFNFISPQARGRYTGGIRDVLELRRRRRATLR